MEDRGNRDGESDGRVQPKLLIMSGNKTEKVHKMPISFFLVHENVYRYSHMLEISTFAFLLQIREEDEWKAHMLNMYVCMYEELEQVAR